jgi:hypothetical protein
MGSVVMSSAPGTLNELADEETKTVYFSVWILGAVNGVSFPNRKSTFSADD